MKRLSYKLTVLFVLAVIAAVGCGRSDVASKAVKTREVRDDLGRTVKVPVNIERAISLAPSVTEMIFAVGAGNRLVGVTTYCNYPADTAAIEKVGDTQTPNIEKIIALRPQIIFISTASQLEAFTRSLDKQGIAVFVTGAKSLDEVFDNLKTLGDLFGRKSEADDLVASLSARANHVKQGNPSDRAMPARPRVFVQISKEPLFTIGRESFLTEIVESAGGISTTRTIATAYPKISKETALALDPDVILLSDSEDNPGPSEVFRESAAVKNGRVFKLDPDIISRPGPRLVDALEEIARDLRSRN